MVNENEIRDAVVKLEAKMEVMSDSMISMASSIAKLADLRYELVGVKKDIDALELQNKKNEDRIVLLLATQRALETSQNKSDFILGKIEVFWTALITGAAAFLWWTLKG